MNYYIIRNREVYWRPNSQGYTSHISEAGVYTFEEATSIINNKRDPPDIGLQLEECKHWIEQDRKLAIEMLNGSFEKLELLRKSNDQ